MKRCVPAAAVAALLAGGAAWSAEWKSQKHKCAISYPDAEGWQLVEKPPDPRTVFAVDQTGGPRAVYLVVMDVDDVVWLNDAFIRGVEGSALKIRPPVRSVVKLSSRRLTVAGVPAYEIAIRMEFEGAHSTMLMRAFLANGLAYSMSGVLNGGDASADEQILEIMSSFRFTSPPKVPKERSSEETLAFKIGELAGGALVIVLIVWILMRILRR